MKIQILLINIALLLVSCNSKGQKTNVIMDITILKDSLWKNYKLWNEATLYVEFNPYKSMISNIDFIPIPVYKLTSKINEYTYEIEFKSCITKDEERVAGFIVINNHIIGFLSGFFRNDKWHPSPLEIFAKQSPLREAFESIDGNMKREVFTVNRLGSLWYTTNGITYVYDFFKKSFIPAKNFIKEQVTLPELKKYYLDEECFK